MGFLGPFHVKCNQVCKFTSVIFWIHSTALHSSSVIVNDPTTGYLPYREIVYFYMLCKHWIHWIYLSTHYLLCLLFKYQDISPMKLQIKTNSPQNCLIYLLKYPVISTPFNTKTEINSVQTTSHSEYYDIFSTYFNLNAPNGFE